MLTWKKKIISLYVLYYQFLEIIKKKIEVYLKIITKYGVGLDNLDVNATEELGIAVGWTGGVNKRSASEQALGFMLGLCRNLFFSSFPLKEGKWQKMGGRLLSGSCVGVIGCGHIGTDVVHLLQPFNCRILICDLLDKSGVVDAYGVTQVSLEKLLPEADMVSLHVPLTELTHFMVNDEFLQQMKPLAHLVNNSRGLVVNQQSLKKACLLLGVLRPVFLKPLLFVNFANECLTVGITSKKLKVYQENN